MTEYRVKYEFELMSLTELTRHAYVIKKRMRHANQSVIKLTKQLEVAHYYHHAAVLESEAVSRALLRPVVVGHGR